MTQDSDSIKCSHLDFMNSVCPICKLEVDKYGNTEYQFDYCSFPDCGCASARVCDAKSGASIGALALNKEHRRGNG